MNNPVDEIKNKLDIVEVISSYIKLTKAGRNYRANCPFHNEKTPSFMVSPERQIWHCFGCGKGGSIFDFVMEIEGIEFGDALRSLAQKAGVELKKIDPELVAKYKTEKTRLYEICSLATQFFNKQLQASQAGKKIGDYLKKRALVPKTIKDWQVGYAPKTWDALFVFLKKCGYSENEILKAGLIIKNEQKGTYYDRFRDRIMFPIKNISGTVVGFSGRENPAAPDERMGKYINTPNTLIYDKSQILYGLDKAKLNIRQGDLCVLVEGQFDVIMAHQAGFSNVVAGSGTALTPFQLKIIKRYTENLALAYDMDLAGETAAKRGFDLALESGLNAKIISLPDNLDPADCFKKGKAIWEKAVKKSQDLLEFYLNKAFSKHNPQTAQGKKEITKLLLPLVAKVANKVEQAHWIQQIAGRLKVSEKTIEEEIKRSIRPNIVSKQKIEEDTADKQIYCQISPLEEYTLGLILAYPKLFKKFRKECFSFFGGKGSNLTDFKKCLPDNLSSQLGHLSFKAEMQEELADEFDPEKEIRFCLCQLKKQKVKSKLDALVVAIKEAEIKKDKKSLKKLSQDFNKLSKQINQSI